MLAVEWVDIRAQRRGENGDRKATTRLESHLRQRVPRGTDVPYAPRITDGDQQPAAIRVRLDRISAPDLRDLPREVKPAGRMDFRDIHRDLINTQLAAFILD